MPDRLKVSYRRKGSNWEGVLKSGNAIIWNCGHAHYNRDEDSIRSGISARGCAGLTKLVVEHPDYPAACRQSGQMTPDFERRLTAAEAAAESVITSVLDAARP